MTQSDTFPVEYTRWLALTDHDDAGSAERIVRSQELYEEWALRADLDGVCILCAVEPRATASRYCRKHLHADPL